MAGKTRTTAKSIDEWLRTGVWEVEPKPAAALETERA